VANLAELATKPKKNDYQQNQKTKKVWRLRPNSIQYDKPQIRSRIEL
jgi:hypothetical protein